MISKKILWVCASFIVILFMASIVGCGSSSSSSCSGGNRFLHVVRNYTGPSNPIVKGITVQALDNDTGEQLTEKGTPVEAVSDSDGKVCFNSVTDREIIAIRVVGGADIGGAAYIDSVQWNIRLTDQDNTAYLLNYVTIFLASLFATGDQDNYTADGGTKAVYASHVIFVGPNGLTDTSFTQEPVGCAVVKYFDKDGNEETVHYQYDNYNGTPSGGQHDTPRQNGGFASFSIIACDPGATPACKTTVRAYEYNASGTGDELTDLNDNPNVIGNMLKSNDDGNVVTGTTYPTGAHPVINLGNTYIKVGATNPEAACQD